MAKLLRTNVADQVSRPVGTAVLMTVEARNAEARTLAATIRRQVELLLGERREQQSHPLERWSPAGPARRPRGRGESSGKWAPGTPGETGRGCRSPGRSGSGPCSSA